MPQNQNQPANNSFSQKVWIAGGIVSLIAVILLVIQATFNVVLLILAGVLVASYFTGLGSLIERKTKWHSKLSLALSIVSTIIFISLLFWLIGAKVQSQITQLTETFPSTVQKAKEQLNKSSLGQTLVEKASSKQTQQKVQNIATGFFKTTFGVLGDIYVVLFIGIFFMVSPGLYKQGIVRLVPPYGRKQAGDILEKISSSLKKWLKGTLFAMLIVFVLTAAGLLIIGVPMWLALAIIAGILNFIPNFGPLIAMVPAVLVGLVQGPVTAVIVAGLYILVQVVESNFITPLIQKKLINIPPALIIIAQLFMAVLAGGWGILLATPFTLIIMILVQEIYIKRIEAAHQER